MRLLPSLLAAATLVLLSACSGDGPVDLSGPDENGDEPDPPVETRSFRMGVSGLIPRNWPEPANEDWIDLFETIPEFGELWGVHTGWNEGELDEDGVPIVVDVAYQAASSGVAPYVAIGVEPDRLTQEEADTYFLDHGDAFVAVSAEIARRHRPEIFLIGVEINRFCEKSAAGFDHFLDVYQATYDAVKAESPATVVGSNFLLEYMRGAGRRSGSDHDAHWDLLDRFGTQLELASFTVYPFLDYDAPGDIPPDYLDEIGRRTDRPLMITETGWPSEPIGGIVGSEDAQVAYLEALLGMVDGLPLRALIWAFPHDPADGSDGGLFDHISMRGNDGAAKRVFAEWVAVRKRPLD